ncbi:hypothetical protein Syun_017154 [Stephania yunnanensis]|uniref:Uncharacterized protein n=1 Tax=Stephania yunnanensis TaxID=152371 RepID=A0AAP0J8R1_9MAGN
MGSECDPCKRRYYDLSMSKRTRKPLLPVVAVRPLEGLQCDSPVKDSDNGKQDNKCSPEVVKRSLRDLFGLDGGTDFKVNDEKEQVNLKQVSNEEAKQGLEENNSLRNHFKQEENNLKLFMKEQEGGGLEGMMLNGAVSRYARILSRLIKINKHDHRSGSVKKTVLRLTM